MPDRLEQLLGVVALAVADRVEAGAAGARAASSAGRAAGAGTASSSGAAAGVGAAAGPEAAALVHLAAWPGTSVGALAAIVGRSQPATVRLLDRLVERGLVERAPGPDRRTLALHPTAAGRRAAEAFLAEREAALAPLLADLGPQERAALEPLLERIVSGLADDRPGAVRVCRECDRGACQTGPGCPLDHTIPTDHTVPADPSPAPHKPARGGRG